MSQRSKADLIIHSASQLLTLKGAPQRGKDLGRLGLIPDGAVAISDGLVLEAGPSKDIRGRYVAGNEVDASGKVVLPGFVDAHTHLVWAGDRAAEFEQRLAGASYMEILAAGGGILSTLRETRAASETALLHSARARLRRMAEHGTTTAEAKTGYGLDLETELRMLSVIRRLQEEGPLKIIPTFLGAHAVPPEFVGDPEAYTTFLVNEALPAVRAWWVQNAASEPLPFTDVFCEEGAFAPFQARRILLRAQDLGFPLKVHAEEFSSSGAARLAVELGAASADHLNRIQPEDIAALGGTSTVAVLLPATPFGLADSTYAPAQALIEAGAIVALGSDLNPGTAWCENLQFVIALACRTMRLTPAQAVAAATINAAAAVGCSHQVGSLEAGKDADLVLLEVEDYRHIAYRFGGNLASEVYRRGRRISPE
jgi:imidazolonepropionase